MEEFQTIIIVDNFRHFIIVGRTNANEGSYHLGEMG
jgi:hypothetical protein